MPIVDTVLVIPCLGTATRMRPSYPKALLSAGPHMLLIDHVLRSAAKAGLDTAYIVLPPEDLKLYSRILTASRFGMRLLYTHPNPEDEPCDMGSIYRGCRRANLSGQYQDFIVSACDYFMSEDTIEFLLEKPMPTALFDEAGKVKMARFDAKILSRLGRRFKATPSERYSDQDLFATIVQQDISATAETWKRFFFPGQFIDVDNWDDLKLVWSLQ